MIRKHRQCPYCKSKVGFRITYEIKGYGHEDITFKGKVLDTDRVIFNDNENYAVCLTCDKLIDTERLEII